MVLYKDISKTASDFLNQDFPHDKVCEVEHRYSGDNPSITSNLVVTRDSGSEAFTSVKYKLCNVFTEIKTRRTGQTTCEVKAKHVSIPGVTVSGKYDHMIGGKVGKSSLETATEYQNDCLHGKMQYKPLESVFTASMCASHKYNGSFLAGGELMLSSGLPSTVYSLGGSYTMKSGSSLWSAALHASFYDVSRLSKVLVYLHGHTANASVQPTDFAAEIQHNVKEGTTSMLFGGKWYLDGHRDTFLKTRISHDAKLGLALTHKFSKSVTATLGAQIDALKPSTADSVKYGLKLNFYS